jgi:hypothetical protein
MWRHLLAVPPHDGINMQHITELDLMPVSRTARALGTSEATVRRLTRTGRLPCLRLSTGERLFRPEDVDRLAVERRGQRRGRRR